MGYLGWRMREAVRQFGISLEIIKRPRKYFRCPEDVDVAEYIREHNIEVPRGFKVLPKRWIVERTFAWMNRYRRLSKDYEYQCETSETMLFVAMTKTMLNRIEKLKK
jgi:transposase